MWTLTPLEKNFKNRSKAVFYGLKEGKKQGDVKPAIRWRDTSCT